MPALLALAVLVAWGVVSWAYAGRPVLLVPNAQLGRFGGATMAAVASGGWWRLFTSQLLHVYLLHALLNAVALWAIGTQLAGAVGTARFVVTAVCAGTAGQIAAVVAAPAIVATGASQAALGVAAATLVFFLSRKDGRSSLPAAVYLMIQLALDVVVAGRPKLPHVVSLAVGAAIGWALGRGRSAGRAAQM